MKKEELEEALIFQGIELDVVKMILEMTFSAKIEQRENKLAIPAVELEGVNERFFEVLKKIHRGAFIKLEDGIRTSIFPVFQSIEYADDKELVIYSLNEVFKAWAGVLDFWLVRKPQDDERFH